VIKFVSDLRQVGGFLRFPPPNVTCSPYEIALLVLNNNQSLAHHQKLIVCLKNGFDLDVQDQRADKVCQ
jgi:hypothetical protein